MLRFDTHPELITHRRALTPEEAHDLAEYGERRGVTVIREVESGHTQYITGTSKYPTFWTVIPTGELHWAFRFDPETLVLIADRCREVSRILSSRYLYGVCDDG